MALEDLNIAENYAALKLLRASHLQALAQSVEDFCNTNVNLNFQQIGLDVFGATYEFNNDGIQTQTNPLIDTVAFLAENETVDGSWTFDNTVSFTDVVTSLSTMSSSGQPRCRAYRATSNQSLADATATAIALAAEAYDVSSLPLHDTSTNNSRMTIPSGGGGVYQFNGQVNFAANATGRREIYIYKNGAAVATANAPTASAGFTSFVQISYQDTANAGDYYELYAYQNSGGALDVVFGDAKTFFSAMKVW